MCMQSCSSSITGPDKATEASILHFKITNTLGVSCNPYRVGSDPRIMMCGRLSTRILGVVVGAATVETSMSFTLLRNARVFIGGAARMSSAASTRMEAAAAGSAGASAVDARQYADFIKEKVRSCGGICA